MNTSAFKQSANIAACRVENDMRAICGMGREPAPADIQKKLAECKAFLATAGRGSGTTTPEGLAKLKACEDFIKKHDPGYGAAALASMIQSCLAAVAEVKYSPAGDGTGLDPEWEKQREYCRTFLTQQGVPIPGQGGGGGNGNTGASFATHSIENIWDLLNFAKASAIILLGASLQPSFLIPANIVVFASFIYATRKLIFKFL